MSRLVPWMCREEWLTTYNKLYNFQDLGMQKQGVQMVQAWKSRCNAKVPLSIETTAGLIAAVITDAENAENNSLTAQLAMAMAIVRFVNGMVDMEQKGVYARSVQSIADDIGLPDWLVDLRHEATHAQLPSLEMLRAGCRFSLSWLNDQYWRAQIGEIEENKNKLADLFKSLVDDFEHEETKRKRKRKRTDTVKEIIQLICQYDMWESAVTILLGERCLLIPSRTVVEKFAVAWPDISAAPSHASVMSLPKQSLALWGPLFKVIRNENNAFLSKLVVALMEKMYKFGNCSEDVLVVRYLACWIDFILDTKTWDFRLELDYASILEACLVNCTSYTPVFLPRITKGIKNLPEQLRRKLEKLSMLITAFCLPAGIKNSVLNQDIVQENLVRCYPQLADHAKLRRMQNSVASKNSDDWQSCDPSFIASFPVGGLVGCNPMQFEKLELSGEHIVTQVNAQSESSAALSADEGRCTQQELMDDSSSDMDEESSDTGNETLNDTRVFENVVRDVWIF